jgi:hypothetical protein
MKQVKLLAAVLASGALLATAVPASADAALYKHYVACGLAAKAKPSHVCPRGGNKGAFFRSNKADVFYTICVKFPTGKNLCARHQRAIKGTLYVNKITSNIPGRHKVRWFVNNKRVGVWFFRIGGGGGSGGSSRNCTSGYSPCLPPASDYDCSGGGGNGPRYANGPVQVYGSDPYGLDRDNDGIGCEL